MNQPFTYDTLIQEIHQCKEGILGSHLPMLSLHYYDFAERVGLDTENKYPLIQHYIKKASYADKRAIFEQLDFKVLYMTLSAVKVSHFCQNDNNGESLNDAFLNKKRNAFILEVHVGGIDTLFFILEYSVDGKPLADVTVDWDELARKRKQQEKIRRIFKQNK